MSAAAPSEGSLAVRALRYRNFRLYIAGLALSLIGTWIQSIAQSWLLYQLTKSEFLLGLATFCTHIPVLLLGPLAGVAADRWPRHRIVLVTQSLFLLQAAALAALTLTQRVTVAHVLILAALLGCANAFDIPARQSLMVLLTSKEDLLGAISLNSVAFNLARTLGPSIGGVLLAAFGPGVCFAINAASFVSVLLSLLLLRIDAPRGTAHGESGGLVEGARYVWGPGPIRQSMILCGTATLTNAAPLVLAPFVADGLFHRGPLGLGLLMAGFGLGATLGVARLAGSKSNSGLTQLAGRGAIYYGGTLLLYALSPVFWIAVGAAFLTGYFFFRHNAANNALVQSTLDERFRGRVMSFYTMMAVGMLPIGAVAVGWMSEMTGPRPVLALSAIAACTAGVMFLRYTRRMEGLACGVS